MAMVRSRWSAAVLLSAILIGGLGCAPLGAVDTGVPWSDAVVLQGEVRSVDARRDRLVLRDERGRDRTLRVDGRTRVTYGSRVGGLTILERGDRVAVRMIRERGRNERVDRIDVIMRANARSTPPGRNLPDARVQRVDGTVGSVSMRAASFTLVQPRSRAVPLVVQVPSGTRREDVRRFERLRAGDRVRVEVRPIGVGYAELVRFR